MKEVIQEAVKLLEAEQPCVLATVVRTKGSTPQKSGSMLLVRQDGTGVGTLGGGCVEGDIWFAAREMLRNHSGPEFKDYFLNEDIAARDGLVCGGTMYFYLEPIWEPMDFLDIGQKLINAYEGGEPVGLATVVNVPDGVTTTTLGAKLLLLLDGAISGTLGNPELDARAIEGARRVADVGSTDSFITEDGVEVFIEGFTTPPTLAVVGGGHVGKATADLANMLGFRVFIADDREEFANPERFPYADRTVVTKYDVWADQLPINVNTFILVATRGHRFDDIGPGIGADHPRPVHWADGQSAEESDDLPASPAAGRNPGTAQGSTRAGRFGHRRIATGGTGGQYHVGNYYDPARRKGRPRCDGRVVH